MSDYAKSLSDSYLTGIKSAAEVLGEDRADEMAEAHVDAGSRWFDRGGESIP